MNNLYILRALIVAHIPRFRIKPRAITFLVPPNHFFMCYGVSTILKDEVGKETKD